MPRFPIVYEASEKARKNNLEAGTRTGVAKESGLTPHGAQYLSFVNDDRSPVPASQQTPKRIKKCNPKILPGSAVTSPSSHNGSTPGYEKLQKELIGVSIEDSVREYKYLKAKAFNRLQQKADPRLQQKADPRCQPLINTRGDKHLPHTKTSNRPSNSSSTQVNPIAVSVRSPCTLEEEYSRAYSPVCKLAAKKMGRPSSDMREDPKQRIRCQYAYADEDQASINANKRVSLENNHGRSLPKASRKKFSASIRSLFESRNSFCTTSVCKVRGSIVSPGIHTRLNSLALHKAFNERAHAETKTRGACSRLRTRLVARCKLLPEEFIMRSPPTDTQPPCEERVKCSGLLDFLLRQKNEPP